MEGHVDSLRDVQIIHEELRKKDSSFLKKRLELLKKDNSKSTAKNKTPIDKLKFEELSVVEKVFKHVKEQRKDVRIGEWNEKEVHNAYLS